MSLASFVKANPSAGECWACGIPERDEIDRGHREHGYRPATIAKWLVAEKGYALSEATASRIKHHFYGGHHERT